MRVCIEDNHINQNLTFFSSSLIEEPKRASRSVADEVSGVLLLCWCERVFHSIKPVFIASVFGGAVSRTELMDRNQALIPEIGMHRSIVHDKHHSVRHPAL